METESEEITREIRELELRSRMQAYRDQITLLDEELHLLRSNKAVSKEVLQLLNDYGDISK